MALPFDIGIKKLNEFQFKIFNECVLKKTGFGLSLPMGSGKTLISILVGLEKAQGGQDPILAIVSKTLIGSWENEIKKFFGDTLKYQIWHNDYTRIDQIANIPIDVQLIITTPELATKIYNQLNIESSFITRIIVNQGRFGQHEIVRYNHVNKPLSSVTNGVFALYGIRWACVIIDEAQKYTKIDTVRSKALGAIYGKTKIAMSGTLFDEPQTSRILGYHVIINDPDFPRSLPEAEIYLKSNKFKGLYFGGNLIYRSSNEGFINEPTLVEHIIEHNLSKEEVKIYITMRQTMRSIKASIERFKTEQDTENVRKFNSYLLAMLTYTRQAVICPIIPLANISIDLADFEKKSELSMILYNEIQKNGLHHWLNNLENIKSSRITKALKIIDDHTQEKIVVFTSFRTCLDLVKSLITTRPTFTISGNMSLQNRQKVLEKYKNTSNGVLLLTFDIGAEGLNLQCSHTILLLDFWWNAGKTQQAIARVLRYGQTSNRVDVYFFTSDTGLENVLFKKQSDKLIVLNELNNGPLRSSVRTFSINQILQNMDMYENKNLLQQIRTKS